MKHRLVPLAVLILLLAGCSDATSDRGTGPSTASPSMASPSPAIASPPSSSPAEQEAEAKPLTVAVIGDVPYGLEQEASVSLLVDLDQ